MSRVFVHRIERLFVCLMLCLGMARAYAQECGCTDPRALNYNPDATVNDGSCFYTPVAVSPYFSTNLDETLNGSSGMVFFDNMLFTHNDHYDQSLFQIDTTDAHIIEQIYFAGIPYQDVEIKFTGLRPGEKLYEELLMSEEGLKETANKKIFIGNQIEIDPDKLNAQLGEIEKYANENNSERVVEMLAEMVPTFNHKSNAE